MMGAIVHPGERQAIEAFMVGKGPRHFPFGDSADDLFVFCYLASKGHIAIRVPSLNWNRSQHRFRIDGALYTRDGFYAFVDRLRAMEDPPRPPIARRP